MSGQGYAMLRRMSAPNKVCLVTGASRGVGAAVAVLLAQRGWDIVLNYRSKRARAEDVAATIRRVGRRVLPVGADITVEQDVDAMLAATTRELGRLDLLVLNASGGLERDRPSGYAMELNRTAQSRLVDAALPSMQRGSTIVFVTSHLAHFYASKPVYAEYEPVAESKYAGEQALRERIDELDAHGVRLLIVSGDVIEGTITPRLMERMQPGFLDKRRAEAGVLPSIDEFARAIVDAALDPELPTGATVYVGATE